MGKYFTVAEMVKSETADRRVIDNRLPKALICNVNGLIDNVLDPLREAYGKPITVTSGYRCEALNKAVRGSKTSEHMKGMAADIVGTPNTKSENKRLFNLVQELGLPFTQLIDEKNFSWVHVSYDSCNVKKQVLKL
jgi:zinc D-Ala-D-Ala carboxypeptidase